MLKELKKLLSKLKIAQITNKKVVWVEKKNVNILFLNFLWKEGFIYGYKLLNRTSYKVFLKYSSNGVGLLEKSVFLNIKANNAYLKKLKTLEKNCNYLVITTEGIFSHRVCIKKGLGGIIIAQI